VFFTCDVFYDFGEQKATFITAAIVISAVLIIIIYCLLEFPNV